MIINKEQYEELKSLNLNDPKAELFDTLEKIKNKKPKSKLYPVFFSDRPSKNTANQMDLGTIILNNDMYKYLMHEIVKVI